MAAIPYPGFGAFVVEGDPALAPPEEHSAPKWRDGRDSNPSYTPLGR
jgi:hypothetical protein